MNLATIATLLTLGVALLSATGCKSIGPGTVKRDRMHYSSAVADSLMFTIQGGAPADFLLRLTAQSIEGHHNQGIYGGQFQPGDASFVRLLQLIRTLSQSRAIELEIIKHDERVETWIRFHAVAPTNAGMAEAVTELKALWGVPPVLDRVRVVFGTVAPEPEVIGMRTRSLLQILSTLGVGVQIPEEHMGKGGVVAVAASQSPGGFTVHSGKKKPEGAFVAVPYEGQWFWIAPDDLLSKTTLSAVTVLFSFLDNSGKQSAPVLTIPTN